MKKVCLINPEVKSRLLISDTKKSRKPWMAPLTLIELAAMFPKNWIVTIWDEFIQGPISIETIKGFNLIGLTGLTPSRYRALDIAAMTREAGVQLIVGGRDVIGWSGEINGLTELLAHYPSVCTSVCDATLMAEIAADAERGQLKQVYRLADPKSAVLILPRRDLIDPRRYFAGCTLRSSESCNRRCAFCTVGGSFHTKMPEVLETEIAEIVRITKTLPFYRRYFLDVADSFAGDPAFASEVILPIYGRSGLGWGTEIAIADLLGVKTGRCLVDPMGQAGCWLVYLGVESVTRRLNSKSSREMAEEAIAKCRRAGMVVVVSLILDGSEEGNETAEEIRQMSEWAAKWADFAQFSHVALLHGCELRRKALLNNAIIEKDMERYGGADPTRRHDLPVDERRRLYRECYTSFSRLDRVIGRTIRAPWRLKPLIFAGGLRYRRGIPLA